MHPPLWTTSITLTTNQANDIEKIYEHSGHGRLCEISCQFRLHKELRGCPICWGQNQRRNKTCDSCIQKPSQYHTDIKINLNTHHDGALTCSLNTRPSWFVTVGTSLSL
ncbi:uncharacterized protein LOC129261906 isoform X1 [Lytechinus pictus]|uniref:uncharacterized protein LOC129261906 isoform X1 n=1 Tax=Lytechinus pictus TaxID=7653 RepID=UPI0030B9FA1F